MLVKIDSTHFSQGAISYRIVSFEEIDERRPAPKVYFSLGRAATC
jgi:hypothetical protein